MRCIGCGCTDQAACSGGCFWVAPNVCSKCLPQELKAKCRDCENLFKFTIQEPDLITVSLEDGEEKEFEDPENIECPDCSSKDIFVLQFERYSVDGQCSECGETIEGGGKAVVVQKADPIKFRETEDGVDTDCMEIEDQEIYHRDCYTDQDQISGIAAAEGENQ